MAAMEILAIGPVNLVILPVHFVQVPAILASALNVRVVIIFSLPIPANLIVQLVLYLIQ